MTGSIERSAWVLSAGIVIGAIVVSISMAINTSKLSTSLIKAGQQSRSHSSTSFPSELRIQLSEKSMDLPAEKKDQLQDAFIKACIGQVYDNREGLKKAIKEVKVNEFKAKYWGNTLQITGDIAFEDGSVQENFESYLYRDGFGGYEGFVRARNGAASFTIEIHIE